MAGPANVRFPGGQKRTVRMRGTKQASGAVQKRLNRSLAELLEDPAIIVPEIDYEVRRARKDPVQRTIRDLKRIFAKAHNQRWLARRMMKRRGDGIGIALAGSLHAAHEEERSTVGVFNHPVYPSASFVRRGNGKPTHLTSIQNHNNAVLRLLAWEEHAKAGWHFFSWGERFVCTGPEARAPREFVETQLGASTVKLKRAGEDIWYSEGLDAEIISEGRPTEEGWIRLAYHNGITVGLSARGLSAAKESFIQSQALSMLPPKMTAIADVEWMWAPEGWPADEPLPEASQERLDELLEVWMNLGIEDAGLPKAMCRTVCANIDRGVVVGDRWYADEDRDVALESLSGGPLERAALAVVLDDLDGGLAVRSDGSVLELEEEVLRFEEAALHPTLIALWPDWGHTILASNYGITGDAADEIVATQEKKRQGFGAFLKNMEAQRSEHELLARFPWSSGAMDGLCGRADALVRKARVDGVGATISMAKKGANPGEKALGWAWITLHERGESEGWHFDSDARDKGGDWVPALSALFSASEAFTDAEDDVKSARAAYVDAMRDFAERSGAADLVEP